MGILLFEEFAQRGGEVEHKSGGAGVGLSESHVEAKRFHFHTGTQRDAGEEISLVGAHVGACFVVVAHPHPHIAGGQKFQSEHQVAHQV